MKPSSLGLLLVFYAAFVALGLPDTVLSAAWPVMHGAFGVGLSALGLIGVTAALSAVASSSIYGWISRKPPPWATLVGSTALMALTMLAFGWADRWWMVVALSIAWGLCGGSIDIELNHFAARHFSRRHMSWLHGCWGIGASTGPLIMVTALSWTGTWQAGFWLLASLMGLLGLAFWSTRALWPRAALAGGDTGAGAGTADGPALATPARGTPTFWALWLSPLCFFLVVACEFATAMWIPSIMADGHGLPPSEAGRWATLYFGALMLTRFALGAFGDRLDNRLQVRLGIGTAIAGASLFVALGASVGGGAGVALMGLGSAPLFPALMHETTRRFSDEWSARMVARQMTGAYAAGALMPLAYGALVERIGVGAIVPTAISLLLLLIAGTTALDRATPPPTDSPRP